ncbi:hypothetical protein [Bartonella grahamii]|uniref:Uncharacterized protein n=1 Tax=Bartonella grahamii TaxID=33045 RepID=A0A336NCV9_BARGR|nr:hypothetical protein [Bartonella grahamii]SSZ39383.1 Uncharacterised protein [Bartonella grahamii]
MKLATNKEIINSWFAKEVKSYNRRIPKGLKDFYEDRKGSLISDAELQQKILESLIRDMSLTPDDSNPLKMFLEQGISFREEQGARVFDTIRGEYSIPVKSGESVDQFKVNDPEIEASSIPYKRENTHTFTMTCDPRERAFREECGLDNLLEEIRSSVREQDNVESYNWLEKLIDRALNSEVAPLQGTQEIYIPDIRDHRLDEKSYELAIKIIRQAVRCLGVHSRLYNACYFQKACSLRDLVFIFGIGAQFDINDQVLNEVMNISTVDDAKNNLLKVQNFGEKNSDVIGLAMSKKAISIDDLKSTGYSAFDPSNLRTNIFFHISQSSLFRPFETMIVFKAGTDDQIEKTIKRYEGANGMKLKEEAEKEALKRVALKRVQVL